MLLAGGPDDARSMKPRTTASRTTGTFARLRAEHGRALDRLKKFERALRTASQRGRDRRPFQVVCRYLAGGFSAHLAVEEAVVYPALIQNLPELALTFEPLREEHAEIRDMIRSLAGLLTRPSTPHRDEQLVVMGRDLTDLLRLHMHKEERSVLDWSERVLPAPVQAELKRRIARALSTASARNRLRP